ERAIPAPIPRPPPVINATFPSSENADIRAKVCGPLTNDKRTPATAVREPSAQARQHVVGEALERVQALNADLERVHAEVGVFPELVGCGLSPTCIAVQADRGRFTVVAGERRPQYRKHLGQPLR